LKLYCLGAFRESNCSKLFSLLLYIIRGPEREGVPQASGTNRAPTHEPRPRSAAILAAAASPRQTCSTTNPIAPVQAAAARMAALRFKGAQRDFKSGSSH